VLFLFKKFFLIVNVVVLSAFSSVAMAADKSIVVVADEWCPFNCSDESLDQGFMIDMAREILSAERYAVKYRTEAWTDAINAVKAGTFDAIVGTSRDEAKGMVLVEEPLGENKNCFYTRLDDPFVYQATGNLRTRRLAVAAGYLYGHPLDDYIHASRVNFNLLQLATGERPLLVNVKKLRARRVDTVIENVYVMDYSLRKYRITGVRMAGCDAATPIYMAISPTREDAAKIASSMAQGIRKLRKSGRMREILAKYGLSDWK
jgi:polar amino acid transport system substrate-binding protein